MSQSGGGITLFPVGHLALAWRERQSRQGTVQRGDGRSGGSVRGVDRSLLTRIGNGRAQPGPGLWAGRRALWCGAVMGLGLGHAPPTRATAPPALATQSAESAAAAIDILVTANKRREHAQDVPLSLWAADAGQLARLQLRDFDDLVKLDPSLTITKTTQPGNNSINIRGVGTYAFSIATRPSVSVVVDDVPQAFQAQAFRELADIERVEVLRGPQSTLFGTAATAGLVNITTAAPTARWSGALRAGLTSDGEYRASGFVSGPLAPDLLMRLSASGNDWRGNLYNLAKGTWVNGQSGVDVRGKLVWQASSALTLTLAPYYGRSGSSCCTTAQYALSPGVSFGSFGGVSVPQQAILGGIVPGPDNRRIRADIDPQGNASEGGGSLRAQWQRGPYTLTAITGYARYTLHDLQDTDNTAFDWSTLVPGASPGGSANGGWFKVRSLTQEVKLTSPEGRRLRFLAAFFYSHTRSERSYVRGSNTLGQDGTLPTVPPTTSAYSTYDTSAFDTNYALYGQATLDVTRKVGLVGGLRLDREEISYRLIDRASGVTYGIPACSTASPSGLAVSTCNSFDALSGRVALQYRPVGRVMAFAAYDRGYKGAAYDLTSTYTTRSAITAPGGLRTIVADALAARQPIAPETVDAFQLGVKATIARHLIWNVTLFREVFHQFQAQSRDDITRQNVLNSIPRVTTQGVEMELRANMPWLGITAYGTYDDARMNIFPGASCYTSQTAALGCVGGQQSLSGKVLPNAPAWKVALNLDHEERLGSEWQVTFLGNWMWQSGIVESLLQDPASQQGAYGLLGLGIDLHSARYSLKLYGSNMLDSHYALNRGRDGSWNINPYGAGPGPVSDAIKWTPGRDASRYVRAEFALNF